MTYTKVATIPIYSIGNCNVAYAGYIGQYWPDMERALFDMLSMYPPQQNWHNPKTKLYELRPIDPKAITLRPLTGILLFAQGTDGLKTNKPYGTELARTIETLKLGRVISSGEVPNDVYQGAPAILFTWIMDKKAIAAWWQEQLKSYLAKESE